RDCERSSAHKPVSWTTGVGGARPATSDAAGTEVVAHRGERIARGGWTTAWNGRGSPQHRGIPFGLRQPEHGKPRTLATTSGTPPRVNRAGAAAVTILVALCRCIQSMAKTGRPRVALRLRVGNSTALEPSEIADRE